MLIRKGKEVEECCNVEDSFFHINDRHGWDMLVYCVWCKSVYLWFRGCFLDFFNDDYDSPLNKKVGELSSLAEKLVYIVSPNLNKSNIKKFCRIQEKDILGFNIRRCIVGAGVGCLTPNDFHEAYLPFIEIKGLGELSIAFEMRPWISVSTRYDSFEKIMEYKDTFKEKTISETLELGGFYNLEQARTIIKFVIAYLKGEVKFLPEWKTTGWYKVRSGLRRER